VAEAVTRSAMTRPDRRLMSKSWVMGTFPVSLSSHVPPRSLLTRSAAGVSLSNLPVVT